LQAAATLRLPTRGRAILGIGTGEREGNEPYGVDWSKPVARFEGALATIRALWNSNGELVTRDSAFILKALSFTASDEVFARHNARHPLGEGFRVRRTSCRTRSTKRQHYRTWLTFRHRSVSTIAFCWVNVGTAGTH
jgi:alkanesulfonate monooxygenase SsuD/methylene tetrahydromethanopterin reductase-like flavin-dependent oxidoreductase (luciferase family)